MKSAIYQPSIVPPVTMAADAQIPLFALNGPIDGCSLDYLKWQTLEGGSLTGNFRTFCNFSADWDPTL